MKTDLATCEQARQRRDRRFDGRFFIAVRSTGIYCRPICPARLPKASNVTFYNTAAAASEAGYRPCLRCRPEAAPGTPAWLGTSTTVTRALRLIHEGALDRHTVPALAERLGITSRHLGRLFQKHLGASPKTVALTWRLQFAKKLIDETGLSMTEVALASGYGSLRRFNDHFQQVYKRPPSSLRQSRSKEEKGLQITLTYRPPYDWEGVCDFLAKRAIPGIEWLDNGTWNRYIRVNNETGKISVSHAPPRQLICHIDAPSTAPLITLIEQVKNLFDLNADPDEINRILGRDEVLTTLLRKSPGIRVPGAWDGFELAIRALVGQQVSVVGASTLMGRIVEQYGSRLNGTVQFPTPEQLMRVDPQSLPMPATRGKAIIALSRAVAEGRIELGRWTEPEALKASLLAIKGIGEWSAEYIALRVLSDPDAFLSTDLVLMKSARRLFGDQHSEQLRQRSHAWRPWRAYAGLLLWRAAATIGERL